MSVVFDFNDSLNDVAPVSPILPSVYDVIEKKKSDLLMDFFCASSFFCLRTIDLECLECCVQHQ